MQLFHTSPTEIQEIDGLGRFDSFLFFSSNVYVTTKSDYVVYSLDIDEDSLIEAGQLFYHEDAEKLKPLVAALAARADVSEAVAESLIEESVNLFDLDEINQGDMSDLADLAWDIQTYSARAAVLLGFRGVIVSDEQGTAYMINMLGHENEMVRE